MPLPVTLDPSECIKLNRHLNDTNNKILNNLHYNKIFTLLEDHYFQERLEQYQTPLTVHQLNRMYTGTFTFMHADKGWIYDPTRNPYHNCPALLQFEVNLVNWRLGISEIELTYRKRYDNRWTSPSMLLCRWLLQTNQQNTFSLLFGLVMILA